MASERTDAERLQRLWVQMAKANEAPSFILHASLREIRIAIDFSMDAEAAAKGDDDGE